MLVLAIAGTWFIPKLEANDSSTHKHAMTWWGYALLSSACWGMQYLLLEILFRRVPFATAYSFLSLVNGILVALVLFCLYPRQDWSQLWQGKRVFGMMVLYLLVGSGAYLFNAYAIRDKDATFASLLEITYPIFIIVFTGLFLRKFHLSLVGSIGAALILAGSAIVVLSRGR